MWPARGPAQAPGYWPEMEHYGKWNMPRPRLHRRPLMTPYWGPQVYPRPPINPLRDIQDRLPMNQIPGTFSEMQENEQRRMQDRQSIGGGSNPTGQMTFYEDRFDDVNARGRLREREPKALYTAFETPQTLNIEYEACSVEGTVTWEKPVLKEAYKFLVKIIGHENCQMEFPPSKHVLRMRLKAGTWYEVTISAVSNSGKVLMSGVCKFKAMLSRNEMIELYQRAANLVAADGQREPRLTVFSVFYRNKPRPYWDEIIMNNNRIMPKYMKDLNGQPGCPINDEISGLFFSCRLASGRLPTSSIYGSHRFMIPACRLFDESCRLYFTDFYCTYRIHYVTLVLARRGSITDRYCDEHLIELNIYDNVFMCMKPNRLLEMGAEYFINNNIWIEILYTEDVDCRLGMWDQVAPLGKGTSTPGGLPNNKTCKTCNLYPEPDPNAVKAENRRIAGKRKSSTEENSAPKRKKTVSGSLAEKAEAAFAETEKDKENADAAANEAAEAFDEIGDAGSAVERLNTSTYKLASQLIKEIRENSRKSKRAYVITSVDLDITSVLCKLVDSTVTSVADGVDVEILEQECQDTMRSVLDTIEETEDAGFFVIDSVDADEIEENADLVSSTVTAAAGVFGDSTNTPQEDKAKTMLQNNLVSSSSGDVVSDTKESADLQSTVSESAVCLSQESKEIEPTITLESTVEDEDSILMGSAEPEAEENLDDLEDLLLSEQDSNIIMTSFIEAKKVEEPTQETGADSTTGLGRKIKVIGKGAPANSEQGRYNRRILQARRFGRRSTARKPSTESAESPESSNSPKRLSQPKDVVSAENDAQNSPVAHLVDEGKKEASTEGEAEIAKQSPPVVKPKKPKMPKPKSVAFEFSAPAIIPMESKDAALARAKQILSDGIAFEFQAAGSSSFATKSKPPGTVNGISKMSAFAGAPMSPIPTSVSGRGAQQNSQLNARFFTSTPRVPKTATSRRPTGKTGDKSGFGVDLELGPEFDSWNSFEASWDETSDRLQEKLRGMMAAVEQLQQRMKAKKQ